MSINTQFIFSSGGNFIYDNSKIEVTDDVAKLKLIENDNQSFIQAFDTDTGFTYDSNLIEFIDNMIKQVDQRPANSIFYASCKSNINANWADIDLIGIAINNAAVSNNKLDLNYNDIRYVEFDVDNNIDVIQQGTINFKLTPNYNGSPSTSHGLFTFGHAVDSTYHNLLQLNHDSDGALRVIIFDKNGNNTINTSVGTWNPTSGTEYEIELNFDVANGATRLFIDGVQFGETLDETCVRDSMISSFRIGTNIIYTTPSNFSIRDFTVYSEVQHTADYTPSGESLSETIYKESEVELPDFNYNGNGLLQYIEDCSLTASSILSWIINDQYWNGSAWIDSDGSASQSSSTQDIIDRLSDLNILNKTKISTKVFFVNSNTQQSVDNLDITYVGQIFPTDNPTIKPVTVLATDDLLEFAAELTAIGSDTIKFTIEVNGVEKYWNGSAWQTSTGYSETNTYEEINTNAESLIEAGTNIKFVAYLHSNDGTTTPELTSVSYAYDFFAPFSDLPDKTILHGTLLGPNGNPQENAVITMTPSVSGFLADKNTWINNNTITTKADSSGNFEIEIFSSELFVDPVTYTIVIAPVGGTPYSIANKTIPDVISIQLSDLID